MFHNKFCVKWDWNVGGFLKVHITFYKYILNISNGDHTPKNYLSNESLLSLIATFFVENTRFLPNFSLNSEFGMRVYRGKIKARSEGISLYTFLRISSRKINILKKTKLDPIVGFCLLLMLNLISVPYWTWHPNGIEMV